MGLLYGVEANPDFVGGDLLSAEALNRIRANVAIADAASRYGRVAFCSAYGNPPENTSENPCLVGIWAFAMEDGATTLTIVTSMTGRQTGDQLRVIRDGTAENSYADGLITDFNLANGEQTHTITISGAGYVERQVVMVRLFLRNATGGTPYDWGFLEVRDMYVDPIDLSGWPGVPASPAITETALDQLSNASTWVLRRLGQRVEPLFQSIVRRPGPFTGDGTVVWSGSIVRSPDHPTVRATVAVVQKVAGTTETLRMRVNGTIVASWGLPTSPRESATTLTYDASAVAAGTRMWIVIDVVKTAPIDQVPLDLPDTSRWSLLRVWAEGATGAASLPDPLSERSGTTFGPNGTSGTLLDWLGDVATAIAAVRTRIVNNPQVWGRQICYRVRYSYDDAQLRWFEPWGVANCAARLGMALLVRGKAITVNHGPGGFTNDFNEVGAQEFENFRREPVIDADRVETQRVYLDAIPLLAPATPYNVRGEDLYYAGEELLAEEL